jgi:hypothetical protein
MRPYCRKRPFLSWATRQDLLLSIESRTATLTVRSGASRVAASALRILGRPLGWYRTALSSDGLSICPAAASPPSPSGRRRRGPPRLRREERKPRCRGRARAPVRPPSSPRRSGRAFPSSRPRAGTERRVASTARPDTRLRSRAHCRRQLVSPGTPLQPWRRIRWRDPGDGFFFERGQAGENAGKIQLPGHAVPAAEVNSRQMAGARPPVSGLPDHEVR